MWADPLRRERGWERPAPIHCQPSPPSGKKAPSGFICQLTCLWKSYFCLKPQFSNRVLICRSYPGLTPAFITMQNFLPSRESLLPTANLHLNWLIHVVSWTSRVCTQIKWKCFIYVLLRKWTDLWHHSDSHTQIHSTNPEIQGDGHPLCRFSSTYIKGTEAPVPKIKDNLVLVSPFVVYPRKWEWWYYMSWEGHLHFLLKKWLAKLKSYWSPLKE